MAISLADRKVSGFPLSISTALAFESLFTPRQKVYDEEREKPEKVDIRQYQELWINIDTLYRNLIQSAEKAALMETGYLEVSSVLADEMDTIISLLNNEGQGWCTPRFYQCDYEAALKHRHKSIGLRQDSTPHQLFIEELRTKSIKDLVKHRHDLTQFKAGIENTHKTKTLILTHQPWDLTAKNLFDKLDLLESNTGKLKTSRSWCTKYYPLPGKDMTHLPFHRFLLLILGDKSLIQPGPFKIRQAIYESSIKRDWTPLTTIEKCLLDLSLDIKNPFDYAVIREGR